MKVDNGDHVVHIYYQSTNSQMSVFFLNNLNGHTSRKTLYEKVMLVLVTTLVAKPTFALSQILGDTTVIKRRPRVDRTVQSIHAVSSPRRSHVVGHVSSCQEQVLGGPSRTFQRGHPGRQRSNHAAAIFIGAAAAPGVLPGST
jgi:hypothetical protein